MTRSPAVHALVGLWCLAATLPAQDLRLRYATFDPAVSKPAVDSPWKARSTSRLFLVQRESAAPRDARRRIERLGARVVGYVPDGAYVVRADEATIAVVEAAEFVRWVGPYEPAYRIEPAIRDAFAAGRLTTRDYHVVLADKRRDANVLERAARRLGVDVLAPAQGGAIVRVRATPAQLVELAQRDEVLWIDRYDGIGFDAVPMDHVRAVGGADHVELANGYSGQGVVGHTYEGLQPNHPDFTHMPQSICQSGSISQHGHAVAGIVFGNGTSSPSARGMLPDAQCLYTDAFACAGMRYSVYQAARSAGAMFSTASWGSFPLSTDYTSVSAALDDAIFDLDLPVTQSQGNSHTTQSRAEAWAKNVISVGAVHHADDADPTNDSWTAGSASSGPSSDGRIKPDLVGFDDSITCSDLTGANGYAAGDYTTSFGGTSAATPIIAGHLGLTTQMLGDGVAWAAPVPSGPLAYNAPGAAVSKAFLLHSARQYAFDATSTDNLRAHQGWGVPDLARACDERHATLVVDEFEALVQGESRSYAVHVGPGEDALRVTMTYAEPMANPAAAVLLINDLDLIVTAPDATVFRGNFGLRDGTASVAGGVADDRDTVERVIVPNPTPGVWQVTVVASQVNADGRPETPAVDDVDFALVVSPVVESCGGSVFGSATPSCNDATGVPAALRFSTPLCRGRYATFSLEADAPAGAVLMLGASVFATPIDLSSFGAPGCLLRHDAIWTYPMYGAGRWHGARVAIPALPGLQGLWFRWTGAFFDPGLNALGIGTTPMMTTVIG